METPFPVTLPVSQLPADYKKNHGLHAKHQDLVLRDPFCQQLAQYKVVPGAPTNSAGHEWPCSQLTNLAEH